MGRQYDFLVDFVAPLSATGSGFGGNIADHPFDNDNLNNDLPHEQCAEIPQRELWRPRRSAVLTRSAIHRMVSATTTPIAAGAHMAAVHSTWRRPTCRLTIRAVSPARQYRWRAHEQRRRCDASPAAANASWAPGRLRSGAATVGAVFTRTTLDDPHRDHARRCLFTTLNGDMLTFNNYELNASLRDYPGLALGGSYTYTDGHFSDTGTSSSRRSGIGHAAGRLRVVTPYRRVSGRGGSTRVGRGRASRRWAMRRSTRWRLRRTAGRRLSPGDAASVLSAASVPQGVICAPENKRRR